VKQREEPGMASLRSWVDDSAPEMEDYKRNLERDIGCSDLNLLDIPVEHPLRKFFMQL
jgi:hypothetical protein